MYIIKAIPTWRRPDDEVFQIHQVVEYAAALDPDNATTLLEELVHLAAHLDLTTNPVHNDLAGTALAQHFFDRRLEPFEPPGAGTGLLVIDLVRSYVHVHRDPVWPPAGLFDALRRLSFEVVRTRGRWRRTANQNLWRTGRLAGSYPRNPRAQAGGRPEPVAALWTNPRFCRQIHLPHPVWPPRPASPETSARVARWTPEQNVTRRYGPALARLNPASDAYALGQFLASCTADELADWFERSAPRCYADEADPERVVSTVLLLEAESPDGEALADALIRLAAKMCRLGYSIPRAR